MEIKLEQTDNKGAFYIEQDGRRLAEMTFSKAGDSRIIVDHTHVDDALRGTGAGKQLVEAAVQFARDNKIKILPLCPFANAVMNKNTSYHDVLDK